MPKVKGPIRPSKMEQRLLDAAAPLAREGAGMSPSDLAAAAGMSVQQVNNTTFQLRAKGLWPYAPAARVRRLGSKGLGPRRSKGHGGRRKARTRRAVRVRPHAGPLSTEERTILRELWIKNPARSAGFIANAFALRTRLTIDPAVAIFHRPPPVAVP